jgi:hypothetical protein
MAMSRDQNSGRSHDIKTDDTAIERMKHFECLGKNLTNKNYIL